MRNALKLTTPTDREIVTTREFDAPRELVWDSIFTPELLRRWMHLGPPGWEMTVCEDDACTGGTFRRVWSDPNGKTMSQSGVNREVVPPERCVRTQVFEVGGVPMGGEQLATIILAEMGERTMLTMTFLFESKEVRDGSVASGMEQGMAAGFDRLDEVLASAAV
jgi:uncharacterized protein YndB with AHSA1/START domain